MRLNSNIHKITHLPLGQDLEESEEVEENEEDVDALDSHAVEDGEAVELLEEGVEAPSRVRGQEHDEEEDHPDEGREADRLAAAVLERRGC